MSVRDPMEPNDPNRPTGGTYDRGGGQRPRSLMARDMRPPLTRTEAEVGLELCARAVAEASGALASRTVSCFDNADDFALWHDKATAALERWRRKAVEFRYYVARFEAGDNPKPPADSPEVERLHAELARAIGDNTERNRRAREVLWDQALRAERVVLQRASPGDFLARVAETVTEDFRSAWNAAQAELGYPQARTVEEVHRASESAREE